MKKQYTLTLTGKVQQIGFRGYAEDLCRQLVIGGIIYNVGEDQVKIICEAEEAVVNKLCQSLKEYQLAEITEAKIEEGIKLPYQLYRVVKGLEQELYSRLDSGIKILENMNESIDGIQQNTGDMKVILERIERKL